MPDELFQHLLAATRDIAVAFTSTEDNIEQKQLEGQKVDKDLALASEHIGRALAIVADRS